MILNNWVPFTGTERNFPDEVSFINVDTRDFGWIISTDIPNSYAKDIAVQASNEYLVTEEEMIELIKDLKEKTGGNGEWRHIELKSKYWLKYIWFVRVAQDHYAMMTRECDLLEPGKMLELIDWSNPYLMTE